MSIGIEGPGGPAGREMSDQNPVAPGQQQQAPRAQPAQQAPAQSGDQYMGAFNTALLSYAAANNVPPAVLPYIAQQAAIHRPQGDITEFVTGQISALKAAAAAFAPTQTSGPTYTPPAHRGVQAPAPNARSDAGAPATSFGPVYGPNTDMTTLDPAALKAMTPEQRRQQVWPNITNIHRNPFRRGGV